MKKENESSKAGIRAAELLPAVFKKIDQETIKGFLRRDYEEAKRIGADRIAARIRQEARGGPCESCGTPWEEIEVKHHYADYVYYSPACRCFPRCPVCGNSWHRVADPGTSVNDRKCPSCGWTRAKQKKKNESAGGANEPRLPYSDDD